MGKKKEKEKKNSKEISFIVTKIVDYSDKDDLEQIKDKLVEELEELDYEVSENVNEDDEDVDDSDYDEDEDEDEDEELNEDGDYED